MWAVDPVLFPAGGKADTPAGKSNRIDRSIRRHLSEFSAGPENSHGASGVQARTPKYRYRPMPKPAIVADPRRCERHQRDTQTQTALSAVPKPTGTARYPT